MAGASKRMSVGFSAAGNDEEGAATLSTSFYTSGNRVSDRVRSVTFQLMNMMTENKKVTTLSKLIDLVLVLADWLQVVAILLSPTFAWDEDRFSWVDNISLFSFLIPRRTPAVFNTGMLVYPGGVMKELDCLSLLLIIDAWWKLCFMQGIFLSLQLRGRLFSVCGKTSC